MSVGGRAFRPGAPAEQTLEGLRPGAPARTDVVGRVFRPGARRTSASELDADAADHAVQLVEIGGRETVADAADDADAVADAAGDLHLGLADEEAVVRAAVV